MAFDPIPFYRFANTYNAAPTKIDWTHDTTSSGFYTTLAHFPFAGTPTVTLRLVSDVAMGSTTLTFFKSGSSVDTDTQSPPAGIPGALFTFAVGTVAVGDGIEVELTTVTSAPANIRGYLLIDYP